MVQAERIDESLIVDGMATGRHSSRLAVCLSLELRRAHVGHPNLHRPQTLGTESPTMFAYSLLDARVFVREGHVEMLHVTKATGYHAGDEPLDIAAR